MKKFFSFVNLFLLFSLMSMGYLAMFCFSREFLVVAYFSAALALIAAVGIILQLLLLALQAIVKKEVAE